MPHEFPEYFRRLRRLILARALCEQTNAHNTLSPATQGWQSAEKACNPCDGISHESHDCSPNAACTSSGRKSERQNTDKNQADPKIPNQADNLSTLAIHTANKIDIDSGIDRVARP